MFFPQKALFVKTISSFSDTISRLFVYFIASSLLYLILLFSSMVTNSVWGYLKISGRTTPFIWFLPKVWATCVTEKCHWVFNTQCVLKWHFLFFGDWKQLANDFSNSLYVPNCWNNCILFYFSLLMCQLYIMVLIVLWFFHKKIFKNDRISITICNKQHTSICYVFPSCFSSFRTIITELCSSPKL